MTPPPPVGIVAGSGISLLALLDRVTGEQPFAHLPDLTTAQVMGHEGRFVHGACGAQPVILQCGRLHCYEGLNHEDVVRTVDALHGFGVERVVFTNAAGGLLPAMRPGDLMAATQLWTAPYAHWPDRPATLEPDFSVPGCDHAGMYMWVHGPSYETRAEIRMLQHLDGAAVGMSTAPEIHRCQQLGIRTAAVSVITNNCCLPQELTHAHVLETADHASEKLIAVLRGFLHSTADAVE